MLVGHYAIGFFGKKLAPKASLAVFVLAAMTADILWCAFMLAGVEHVEFTSGRGAGQYFKAIKVGSFSEFRPDCRQPGHTPVLG
jgi:hypothetical protein